MIAEFHICSFTKHAFLLSLHSNDEAVPVSRLPEHPIFTLYSMQSLKDPTAA
jgi:hypothetical protein